jgi:hypothetical protein
MLTDAQLTTKTRFGTYRVLICHKRESVPSITLTTDAKTRSEAREIGHEYALRIQNLRRSDYYLLVEPLA